ncbi:MAG: TonB-dependent receptor, partial [Bacteroidales bacterium]|nr:TonB-dependent receptor [Bacteroidales bacterium]
MQRNFNNSVQNQLVIRNKVLFIVLLINVLLSTVYSQRLLTGTVKDSNNGEPVEGATILSKNGKNHTHTANDGSFSFLLAQLPDSIFIVHTGYKTWTGMVNISTENLSVKLVALPVELSQVTVVADQQPLNQIMKVDLEMNPVNTSQDLLRKTPGLFIAQHAGGGKAEQIFMRGFDADHGTDVRLTVDDLPVNMVSHAHGQGYSDLHFVIPETVENIDFGKGASYADKGDFTTAGYVNLKTFDRLGYSTLKLEGGMFNSIRLLSVLNLLNETSGNRQSMYVAGEYNYTDGPFNKPQHFNRINLFAKYSRFLNDNTHIGLTASTFSSKWDASGQVPDRAVNAGLISRWGAIDDTEGGNTGRTNIALTVNRFINENTRWQSLFYFVHYDFNLFSNFTLFLNDPEFGDEIQQRENRNIYGMEHKYSKRYLWGENPLLWKSGVGLRYDDIGNIELNHVFQRGTFLEPLSYGAISETNINAFSSLEWNIGKWMINPGLRFDCFVFNVEDKLQPATATQGETAFRVSPKFNLFYNANRQTQLYLKTGMGFHSNDARVVVAQHGRNILPYSLGGDFGVIFKPLPELLIQPAIWYLFLQQEFVYVGDEAVVEPSGKTQRFGVDLSVRYQPLKWLYIDA